MAEINGSGAGETIDGTLEGDIISGLDGDDIIDGLEGDDIIIGGAGADILTGGDGLDIFSTSGDIYSNTLNEFYGDTITDFSAGEVIRFYAAFEEYGNFTYTPDPVDPTTGVLDLGDGNVLTFENMEIGARFATFSDRASFTEIRLFEEDGFNFLLDEDKFEIVNKSGVGDIAIEVTEGTTIGYDPSGIFPHFGSITLTGETMSLLNEGSVLSAVLRGTTVDILNYGIIGGVDSLFGVVVGAIPDESGQTASVENAAGGSVFAAAAFTVDGTGLFDTVTVRNDGYAEAAFVLVQGGGFDLEVKDLEIINTGTMITRDSDHVYSGQASLGITASGAESTRIINEGTIEVQSTNGGTSFSSAVVFSLGQTTELVVIENSGTVISTSDVAVYDYITQTNGNGTAFITNHVGGVMIADSDNDGDGRLIRAATINSNSPDTLYETRANFVVANDGEMVGDIKFFVADDFSLAGGIVFRFQPTGIATPALSIAGIEDLIDPLTDEQGNVLYDENNNPIFPDEIEHPSFGTLQVVIEADRSVSVYDSNGDKILVLPEQADIADGSFDDMLTNNGSLTGDVFLGLGDDSYLNTGTTTGEVFGGSGADSLVGGATSDTLYGEVGNDFLAGRDGDDVLDGGDGDDRMFGEAGADLLRGGLGNDYLVGNDGNDVLAGGDGADNIQGRDGDDRLFGEGGHDRILGGT
ncbi:hypothetical protein FF098_015070, partial [Parvularcula flava]|nr:hypothetical protein [Aquisalinus luteolus]